MNKKQYLIALFTLLFVLLALKPLAPQPNNELWVYSEGVAGETLREINCTRPTPTSAYSCQVVTHDYQEAHGLGVTPQIALDNALNNLP